jgi:hypothetical protein
MTEQELRELVRDAVSRHVRHEVSAPQPAQLSAPQPAQLSGSHPSHALLILVRGGGDPDGACLIEPTVRCVHCGYCQSYGH